MMRENWTEGGEDEEGKRRRRWKREREREKDDREVKRGTDTGQQGYEDRVGRGVEGGREGGLEGEKDETQ